MLGFLKKWGNYSKMLGFFLKNCWIFWKKWGNFCKMWGFLGGNFGGDKWGFLIDIVRIYNQDLLATLALCSRSQLLHSCRKKDRKDEVRTKSKNCTSAQRPKIQLKISHHCYFSTRKVLTWKRILEMTYNQTWFLNFQAFLQSFKEQ